MLHQAVERELREGAESHRKIAVRERPSATWRLARSSVKVIEMKRAGLFIVIALAVLYGWMTLRGPQGLQALIQKHHEVQRLEQLNSTKAQENALRREHIQRL